MNVLPCQSHRSILANRGCLCRAVPPRFGNNQGRRPPPPLALATRMRSIDDAQLEQLKAPNTNFEELLRHRIHQENASEFSSENGVVAQSDHFTPARHGEAGRLKPSEARAQRNRRPRASDHDENGEVKPATSTNLPEDSNLHADEAFIHQLESLSSKEEAGKRAQVPKR